jgi:cytidylate kinase
MLARGVKRVLPVAARAVGGKVHRAPVRVATSAVAAASQFRSNVLGSIRNYAGTHRGALCEGP